MGTWLRRCARRVGLLLVAALCGAGLVTMVSAHGGDTSLIHACVAKNGSLRIVGANEACSRTETALDWNIAGQPGPAGSLHVNRRSATVQWVPANLSQAETYNQLAEVWCLPGEQVTGGGFDGRHDGVPGPEGGITGVLNGASVGSSIPVTASDGRQGWQLAGYSFVGYLPSTPVTVYALCAAP